MTLQLTSITVQAFRGVRGTETFEFSGENAIVLGPNGSGKSTVVQAIEFLLTGEISALRGSGTGGISVTDHIPNRYADPADTEVQGTFSSDEIGPFEVVRTFTNRGNLRAEQQPQEFSELVTAASQGFLFLSRDELLELVISTPGSRKKQIYKLLNTEEVDERRRQLKRLARNAESEADKQAVVVSENRNRIRDLAGPEVINATDGTETLNQVALRRAVNERRAQIGGDSLGSLTDEPSFTSGLASPVDQAGHPLQRTDVRDHLMRLDEWFASGEGDLATTLKDLRSELRVLQADEELLDSLAERSLIQQGRDLVGLETTACPLCKTVWAPGKLRTELEVRAERLERLDERTQTVQALSREASQAIDSVTRALNRLVNTLGKETMDAELDQLESYGTMLKSVAEHTEEDFIDDPASVSIEALCLESATPHAARDVVIELTETAAELPQEDALQQAWNELQSLEEAYRGLQDATTEQKRYARAADELSAAHSHFLQARDRVLGDMFKTLSGRFAEFYEAVNPDESAFDPRLGQTSTGVEFAVEFYDQGEHPPNALHSEGHQDLMGVCLFLALVAEFSPLERTPVLLDDVLMAVDSDHRCKLASVLATKLSEHFQFVLTTHDPAWATQLVDAGAVRDANVIRFTGWTPDQGPEVTTGTS